MSRFLRHLLVFAAALTALGCQIVSKPSADSSAISDFRNPYDNSQHLYILRTDSESEISLKIRFSKAVNDVYCNNSSLYTQDTISAAELKTRHFSFSRMGSPHIALYEWHLCFEHEGRTYKGWRGFDPGPDTSLSVNCDLEASVLEERTEKYVCSLNHVSLNRQNYSEYAALCSPDGTECRRFESEREFAVWDSLNSDPRLAERLTLAVLKYDRDSQSTQDDKTYAAANPMPIFLSVEGSDPTPWLLHRLRAFDVDVYPGSEWDNGKGMTYTVDKITPISGNSVSLIVSTYCGLLCASGSTVVLVLEGDEWKVISHEMNWIS